LTENNDVLAPLPRGALRLGFALGAALVRAGPDSYHKQFAMGSFLGIYSCFV